jgi:hypothetical protein
MNSLGKPLLHRQRPAALRRGLCLLLALAMALAPLVQSAAAVHGLAHGEQSHFALAHAHSEAHSLRSGPGHGHQHEHDHEHGHEAGAADLLHALAHAAHAGAQSGLPADAWPSRWTFARLVLALAEAPVRGGIESRDGPFRPPISA